MKTTTIKDRLIEAVRSKDIEAIKLIKQEHGRERWLKQFGNSVPISAWVDPVYNPEGVAENGV